MIYILLFLPNSYKSYFFFTEVLQWHFGLNLQAVLHLLSIWEVLKWKKLLYNPIMFYLSKDWSLLVCLNLYNIIRQITPTHFHWHYLIPITLRFWLWKHEKFDLSKWIIDRRFYLVSNKTRVKSFPEEKFLFNIENYTFLYFQNIFEQCGICIGFEIIRRDWR